MPPYSSLPAETLDPRDVQKESILFVMKSSGRSNDMTPLPDGFIPGEFDVICSWARQNHYHGGNIRFRKLVDESAIEYIKARTKHEKTKVIADLIDKIRSDSPGGGFVRQDYYSGCWYEIGLERARDKVGHAIRKAADNLVEQNKKGKGKKAAIAVAATKDLCGPSHSESASTGQPHAVASQSSTTSAHILQPGTSTSCPESTSPFQGRLTPPDVLQRYDSSKQIIISDSLQFDHPFLGASQPGSISAGEPYYEANRLSGDFLLAATTSLVNDHSSRAPVLLQQPQFSYVGTSSSHAEGVPLFHRMHATRSPGLSSSSNIWSLSAGFPTPSHALHNYEDPQFSFRPELDPGDSITACFIAGINDVGGSWSRQMEEHPTSVRFGIAPSQYQSEESSLPSTVHERTHHGDTGALYRNQPEDSTPRSNRPPES